MQHDRIDLAERAFERAIEVGDPKVAAQALWQLGKLCYGRGEVDRAYSCFQRAVESGDDDVVPRAQNGLGVVCAARGDVAEAQRDYLRAIESKHPDAAPRATWNLGLLFLDQEDVRAAEAAFTLGAESGHAEIAPRAAVQLGLARAQLGDTEGAATALEGALDAEDPDVAARAALNLGLVRLTQKDAAGAQHAWKLALASPDPEHVEAARGYLSLLDKARTETPPTPGAKDASASGGEYPEEAADAGGAELSRPALRLTSVTALDEVILLSEEDADGAAAVLQQFRMSDVFGLGHPAGNVSPDGHGTESDLLHFSVDDESGNERVLLPVFTQASIMTRALTRNPDWQKLSVLQLRGDQLCDNIDPDVTLVINPWSRLEFQLPRGLAQSDEPAAT